MARITYSKTRKGETITMRADKGEDLRDVIKAMATPVAKTNRDDADREYERASRERVVLCDKCDGPNDRANDGNYCSRCRDEFQARIARDPETQPVGTPADECSTCGAIHDDVDCFGKAVR